MKEIHKKIVHLLLEKKILISQDILVELQQQAEEELMERYVQLQEKSSEEIEFFLKNNKTEENNAKEDKSKEEVLHLKEQPKSGTIAVVYNHQSKKVNKSIIDFVSYFTTRYKTLEKILRKRQELQGLTSIKRIIQKQEKEAVSLIGLVKDVVETKKRNLIITVEDHTGEIPVIINATKKELFEEAKTLVFDEVIGVVGVSAKNAIFADKILWPDIPLYNELKKAPAEEYAVFLSDVHVGSKQFLQQDFEKFIKWVRGELGSEKQQNMVKKLKYIFFVGDIVDGINIYPGQEHDLKIVNLQEQYTECARLLQMIPSHIQIIICPGNHDAMRLAEPQLPIYQEYAQALYDLPNVLMVSNPAMLTIGVTGTFPGLDVLLYHGYSFDYYIATVDEIRNNGGYDRADLVMKFMLKRRHLAPTHASCLYIPFPDDDPLIISKVPDIFATGHLHKVSVSHYRNVTLIGSSCWQGKTAFQEKMGHHPEPCRVPIVNLQTREVKILRFGE